MCVGVCIFQITGTLESGKEYLLLQPCTVLDIASGGFLLL
jgi:hypothetical protein